MKRRTLVTGLATLPLFPAAAAAQLVKPYRMSLVGGGRPGEASHFGIRVDLESKWKTYWRNPGESGIPPSFDWSASDNLAAAEVLFPLPTRHRDESGEMIGYFGSVVFPVKVAWRDAGRPSVLRLAMFFGVCREVCIPAEATAEIAAGAAARDRELVMAWEQRVPAAADIVTQAAIESTADGPVLALALDRPVDDVFVEADSGAYFRAPVLSQEGRTARIGIGNLASPDALAGKLLRLTFDAGGMGLEQSLRLP